MSEIGFIDVANEVGSEGERTFVIMFEEGETLNFPMVYRNEGFVVYEIAR